MRCSFILVFRRLSARCVGPLCSALLFARYNPIYNAVTSSIIFFSLFRFWRVVFSALAARYYNKFCIVRRPNDIGPFCPVQRAVFFSVSCGRIRRYMFGVFQARFQLPVSSFYQLFIYSVPFIFRSLLPRIAFSPQPLLSALFRAYGRYSLFCVSSGA